MSASILPCDLAAGGISAKGAHEGASRAPSSDALLQRAFGEARITVSGRDRPRIGELYQKSPARILTPRIDGRAGAEIVFVNTSGGVAGGDVMRYSVGASGGAQARVTTQAAEKIYRALDRTAVLENRIRADGEAAVEWLPQSSIVFDGARLARRTEIDVARGARVLAFDSIVLGRAAHGETVRSGAVRDDWRVRRDGRLVWADAFRLTSDIAAQTSRPALLGGHRAFASFLYAADECEVWLEPARELIAGCGGAARIGAVNGLLVGRFLADSAHELMDAAGRFIAGFREMTGAVGPWPPAMWRC